jgi:hypothetical protein
MDLRAITDLAGGRLTSGKLVGPVGPADFPPISGRTGRTGNPLPIGCGSTFFSRLSPRPPRTPGGPLTCASPPPLLPSSPSLQPPSCPTHNVMLTNITSPQMPILPIMTHGTPASPLPSANPTPLLRRRHRPTRLTDTHATRTAQRRCTTPQGTSVRTPAVMCARARRRTKHALFLIMPRPTPDFTIRPIRIRHASLSRRARTLRRVPCTLQRIPYVKVRFSPRSDTS